MSAHYVGLSTGAGGIGGNQVWESQKPGFNSWLCQFLKGYLTSLDLRFSTHEWMVNPMLYVNVKIKNFVFKKRLLKQACISRHQKLNCLIGK